MVRMGEYDEHIVVNKPDVTIRGSDPENTVLKNDALAPVWDIRASITLTGMPCGAGAHSQGQRVTDPCSQSDPRAHTCRRPWGTCWHAHGKHLPANASTHAHSTHRLTGSLN